MSAFSSVGAACRAVVVAAAVAWALVPLRGAAQSIAVNVGATPRVVVAPGAKFAVPLIIDLAAAGAINIASLQAGLTWGAARMTFDSIRVAAGVSWLLVANTTNAAAGSITFNAFDAVALPATATVANAYFTASGAEGGTRLVLAPTAAGSAGGANVLPFIRPRSLDVCVAASGRVGDVNGDDAVNIIDAQQISRFSVGLSVADPVLLAQRGDVNASGAVDIVDGQQIARFSVGLDAAPLINTVSTFIPAATALVLSPSTAQSLGAGGSVQLNATPSAGPVNLTGCAPVSWQSSNVGVAVVNGSGLVTGVAGGSANITATSGTASAQVGVSVSGSSSAPVASVTVALSSPTINVGATAQATATLRDASNNLITGRPITWSSSNASCATVHSSTGVVTGVAACSANIRATAEGITGQAAVTVQNAPVSTVSVALGSSSLNVGETTQATATVRDAGGNVLTGRAVVWSSSNTARATVSSSGVVTAVSSGSVNIIATVEGVTGQAALTVATVPVASITVSLAATSIQATSPIQTTTQATATLRDASGNILTGRTVTWSSSNTARATVNSSGVVTAVSAGTADIIATAEGVTGLRTITLTTPAVASVSVSLGAASILPGATTVATAVLRDDKTNVLTGRTVTFSSSNTSVATVGSSSGTVTGVATGTANIVATSEGVTGQATVTVAQSVSNEPPGMTMLTDRPFNCLKPSECEADWDYVGNFSIVDDPTAPRSPSKVGQMFYPAGFTGGVGPGSAYRGAGNRRVLYVSLWMKLSPNFQNHITGINKIFHFYINGLNRIFFQARGETLAPSFGLQQLAAPYNNGAGQTATAVILSPNVVPSAVLVRGQWHRIEIILTGNTPGVADGAAQVFLDGLKVIDFSGIMYAAAGGSGVWEYITWNPTWGGSGDVVSSDMFIRVDHLYASVKN